MSDSPDPLDFTPVFSASTRHDGWTEERQRGFIAELARIGVVSAAARAVGMSPKSAYALLSRAGPDSSFGAAWHFALNEGRIRSLGTAIERALNGVTKPVFYRGRPVGERRSYNDGLLIAALRYGRPEARKPPRGA